MAEPIAKVNAEIRYCVPCSYHGTAAWIATEIFAEGGNDVAITMTPGVGGVLQIFADGDKLYDKADEDGKFPDLPRVKEIRAQIHQRLET